MYVHGRKDGWMVKGVGGIVCNIIPRKRKKKKKVGMGSEGGMKGALSLEAIGRG